MSIPFDTQKTGNFTIEDSRPDVICAESELKSLLVALAKKHNFGKSLNITSGYLSIKRWATSICSNVSLRKYYFIVRFRVSLDVPDAPCCIHEILACIFVGGATGIY